MKKLGKLLGGLVVVLLLLFAVAEMGARWYVSSQLTRDDSATTVDFGRSPLVFGLAGGTIPHLEITTPNELPDATPTHLDVRNLNLRDTENPVAGHLVVTTEVSAAELLRQFQAEQQAHSQGGFFEELFVLRELTPNPQEGTLTAVLAKGAVRLDLHPTAHNGQIAFTVPSASLLGFTLGDDIATTIGEALTSAVAQEVSSTAGVRVDSITVTPIGLALQLSGDNVPLGEYTQRAVTAKA